MSSCKKTGESASTLISFDITNSAPSLMINARLLINEFNAYDCDALFLEASVHVKFTNGNERMIGMADVNFDRPSSISHMLTQLRLAYSSIMTSISKEMPLTYNNGLIESCRIKCSIPHGLMPNHHIGLEIKSLHNTILPPMCAVALIYENFHIILKSTLIEDSYWDRDRDRECEKNVELDFDERHDLSMRNEPLLVITDVDRADADDYKHIRASNFELRASHNNTHAIFETRLYSRMPGNNSDGCAFSGVSLHPYICHYRPVEASSGRGAFLHRCKKEFAVRIGSANFPLYVRETITNLPEFKKCIGLGIIKMLNADTFVIRRSVGKLYFVIVP